MTCDDRTVIYIEVTGSVDDIAADTAMLPGETVCTAKGASEPVARSFPMQGTIHAYTSYTLNAFRQIAEANLDKVTLEFGVKVSQGNWGALSYQGHG